MMAAEKHLIDIDQIASGAMVFRFSDQGVILDYMNNALCQMLHCEKEDIECQDFNKPLRRVHPVDARRLWPIFLNLPNTGKMKCDFRFRDYLTEQWCWLSVNGTYAQDEKGQCAYCIFTDITQQQESIIREHSLLRCLQWIVAEQNWQENMDHVLEEVMKQYQADRAYIFEFDWDNQLMSNTWEAVAPGVIPEKKNLQNMPVELIDYWLPYFTEGRPVFIEELEQIKNDASRHNEYKVLAAQDIDSLMTIPILNNKKLYAYIGVDNPMYHSLDKGFLYTIAQILGQEYHAQEQERKLIDLSMRDPLTNINNRHAYNAKLDELSSANSIGIGVLFSDVNGLKYVNDNYGHQAGDRLIIRTVEVLEKYFHKHEIYRISGDEFVVIEENIDEKAFYCKINQVKEDVANVYDGIFAIGQIWKRGKIDIQAMIDEAENQMYQDKEIFYANAPAKKRQHPNKSLLG